MLREDGLAVELRSSGSAGAKGDEQGGAAGELHSGSKRAQRQAKEQAVPGQDLEEATGGQLAAIDKSKKASTPSS